MLHLGNHPSPDRDRVDPLFERPKGLRGMRSRENYETANSLGLGFGGDIGAIRRWARRRRADASVPSRFGIKARPGTRGGARASLLVDSHDELEPRLAPLVAHRPTFRFASNSLNIASRPYIT